MKFESKYLSKNISKKYRSKFILSLLVGPFLTIGLWAIYISRNLPDGGRKAIGKVIEGIKVMPTNELVVAALCGIPMAGLIILMGQALHNRKKLIVFLEFDHNSELLKIKTRPITKNRLEHVEISYSKLRIRTEDKIYDGMTMGAFEGIEFLNNGRYVGYLLKDHFTWTKDQLAEINMELTKIGKAPNLL